LRELAVQHLSPAAIDAAGLLDGDGVQALLALHEAPDTSDATRVQLDASINHLLGVQILHQHFVAGDIPRQARETAARLGWHA
jgi:asparagine synthase (glutamine-hydrolysing)